MIVQKLKTYGLEIALFLSILAVYLITVPHTVTLEDSGLFILSAWKLGLAHPPGYPLYTMVGKLFTMIPVGSIAFRVHLLSMLSSIFTCLFMYLSLRILIKDKYISLFLVAIYAFSNTFWGQSIIAEVYAFNTFFFSLCFYLCLRLREEWSVKTFFILSVCYGLGLANHWPLLGLATPALLLMVWPQKDRVLKNLHWGVLLVAVGCLPYFYLMIRSTQDPEISFVGSVETFRQLIDYILRSYYSQTTGSDPIYSMNDAMAFLGSFVKSLPWEFNWLLVPMWVAGLTKLVKDKKWQVLAVIALLLASTTLFLQLVFHAEFTELHENTVKVWHLIAHYSLIILAGYGLLFLISFYPVKKPLLYSALALSVVLSLVMNFNRNNLRHDRFAADFAVLTLKALPKAATLFVRGDTDVGPISYVMMAEGVRQDVRLLNQSGHFFKLRLFDPRVTSFSEKKRLTTEFIKENGRVFSTKALDVYAKSKDLPFEFVYNGLFYDIRYNQAASFVESPEIYNEAVAFIDKYMDFPTNNNHWYFHRKTIFQQLCNYIVLRDNVNHPIYDKELGCSLIKARHMARLERYKVADKYFYKVLSESDHISLGERFAVLFDYMKNHVKLVNVEEPDLKAKQLRLQDLADYLMPYIWMYKKCDNHVLGGLLSVRAQLKLNMPMKQIYQTFGKCKKFKPYFEKIN